jgi:hypothetical protein
MLSADMRGKRARQMETAGFSELPDCTAAHLRMDSEYRAKKATRGLVPIGYRGAQLSSLLHVNVYVTHNLLNVLVKKLHGLSRRANYTDRATAACRRSDCQLLRIECATWSALRIPTAVFSVF